MVDREVHVVWAGGRVEVVLLVMEELVVGMESLLLLLVVMMGVMGVQWLEVGWSGGQRREAHLRLFLDHRTAAPTTACPTRAP